MPNIVWTLPARDVVGFLVHATLRTLDHVRSAEAFVQRGRKLQPLNGEHLRHALA